jgi:site-specific DNA-methyltransferase (adenine-specific)
VDNLSGHHITGCATEDPFAGSGSTCAAAFDLGRRYIGVELDAGHHHTACVRMERRREKAAA